MALLIFPVEVWEMVLEKLETSSDVQNVFKAYPELEREGVLKTKRQLWMFDQVITQIFPTWLTTKDILSCRQVCRQWSLAVDSYLETYSFLREHDHDAIMLGQSFPTRAFLTREFYFPQYFVKPRWMSKFLHGMKDCPPDRNPFIGRSISLSKGKMPGICFVPGGAGYAYWLEAMKLLGKFGHHIWTLRIHRFVIRNLDTPIQQLLIDVLSLVPNLKRLQLETITNVRSFAPGEPLEEEEAVFPPLPNLETLEIEHYVSGLWQDLIDELVRCYSSQIKVIRITHFYWKPEHGRLFPNLEEFALRDSISKEDASEILHSLYAPKLSSLSMTLKSNQKCILETNIVQWLSRFLAIEKLNIQLYYGTPPIEEEGGGVLTPPSRNLTIPSLKYLTLRNKLHDLDFTFLQSFPSLEFLKIIPFSGNNIHRPEVFDQWKLLGSPQSNIFETLPKLKEIHLAEGSWSLKTIHYTRAQYDYFKRFGGCPELAIRAMVKDIQQEVNVEQAEDEEVNISPQAGLVGYFGSICSWPWRSGS